MRIGLTGGIASGKTTVSSRLAELGAAVLDADAFARIAVKKRQRGAERDSQSVRRRNAGLTDVWTGESSARRCSATKLRV